MSKVFIALAAAAQIGSTVMSTMAAREAADIKKQQLELDMMASEVEGIQEANNELTRYMQAIGTIEAQAAHQSLVVGERDSVGAILRNEKEVSKQNLRNIKTLALANKARIGLGIKSAKLEKKSATLGAVFDVMGTAASAGTQFADLSAEAASAKAGSKAAGTA